MSKPWFICAKVKYPTRSKAHKARVNFVQRMGRGPKASVYYCKLCRAFHWGKGGK